MPQYCRLPALSSFRGADRPVELETSGAVELETYGAGVADAVAPPELAAA